MYLLILKLLATMQVYKGLVFAIINWNVFVGYLEVESELSFDTSLRKYDNDDNECTTDFIKISDWNYI